ncbi:hypothetical protein D8S78_03945 [Natrialba swarupiae]|nr:hypothetical protein [Natrialba swarupiae]
MVRLVRRLGGERRYRRRRPRTPDGPPPDANGVGNSIDRIAGSPYSASTVHEHDADELRLQEGLPSSYETNTDGHTRVSRTGTSCW